MALEYAMVERHNPQRMLEKKWYPQVERKETVGLEEVCKKIAYSTSMTDSDVLAVLRALMVQVKNELLGGNSVALGELGIFSLQIVADGSESKEDFSVARIKKLSIRFRPNKMLKIHPSQVTYVLTAQRKEIQELLNK